MRLRAAIVSPSPISPRITGAANADVVHPSSWVVCGLRGDDDYDDAEDPSLTNNLSRIPWVRTMQGSLHKCAKHDTGS